MPNRKFTPTATATALMITALLTLKIGNAAASTANPKGGSDTAPAANSLARVEVNGEARPEDPNSGVAKRIVTRAELDTIASTNLLDALRRIPGLAVLSNGRTSQISLNGLGGGYTAIQLDGATPPPGFNLETLGSSQIERIEISRVATAEQSGRAIAGVINIVMRKAQPSKANELKLVASGSSQNSDHSAAYVRNDSIGRVSNALSFQLRRFDFENTTYRTRVSTDSSGQQIEAVETLDHVDSLSGNLSGRTNWKTSDTSNIQIDYGGVFRRTGYASLEHQRASTSTSTSTSTSENSAPRSLDRSLRAKISYSEKLMAGASYDVRASLGRGSQSEARTFRPSMGASMRRDADRSDHLMLIGSTWRTSTDAFGKVSAGAEWERSERQDSTWPVSAMPSQADTDGGVKTTRGAAFVQSDFDLLEEMPAYLGIRYEWLGLDSRFVQDGSFLSAQQSSSQWSPVFQARYKFVNDGPGPVLRIAVRRGYKVPSQDEVSLRRRLTTVNGPLSPDEIGNINLRPESSDIYEIGIESPLQKWGSFSLNLSHRELHDMIQRVLQLDGSRWQSAPVNLGRARADGIDIDLKASLQKLDKALPRVDIRVGYGIYSSRVSALPFKNNTLLQQLPWNANATVDWQWSSLPVTISMSYSKFGAKLVRLDALRAVGTPSIENIDLSASFVSSRYGIFRGGVTNASAPSVGLSDYFYSDARTTSQQSHYRRPAGIKLGWETKF